MRTKKVVKANEAGPIFMISAADILNASILIVDDQDANVLLLERMLSGIGYALYCIDDGSASGL